MEDELNDLLIDDEDDVDIAAAAPFLPDAPTQVCLKSIIRSTCFFQPACIALIPQIIICAVTVK